MAERGFSIIPQAHKQAGGYELKRRAESSMEEQKPERHEASADNGRVEIESTGGGINLRALVLLAGLVGGGVAAVRNTIPECGAQPGVTQTNGAPEVPAADGVETTP